MNAQCPARAPLGAVAATAALICRFTCSPALAATQSSPQTPAAANAAFAFKLVRQFAKDQPRANIFISPYGASAVLQMSCNGAGGQTKSEIQQALGTASLRPDEVTRANKQLTQSLNAAGTNVVVAIANAIWCRAGSPIRPDFIAANQQSFDATVANLDFNDPRSVQTINAWAAEKTHGKL